MDLTYMALSKIPTLSGCQGCLQLCQNILYGGIPEQGLACHEHADRPSVSASGPSLMTDRLGAYFSNTVTDQMASRLYPPPPPPVPSRIVFGDNELGVTHLGGGPEAHRDGQQGNVLRTNMGTCLPHSQGTPSISGLCLVL